MDGSWDLYVKEVNEAAERRTMLTWDHIQWKVSPGPACLRYGGQLKSIVKAGGSVVRKTKKGGALNLVRHNSR